MAYRYRRAFPGIVALRFDGGDRALLRRRVLGGVDKAMIVKGRSRHVVPGRRFTFHGRRLLLRRVHCAIEFHWLLRGWSAIHSGLVHGPVRGRCVVPHGWDIVLC